ncbi:Uncharacterised protein [Mycobacterium tuberculosis]|nr:Uncharacterised protein [Mycobacterium tuberculosis]
MAVSQARIHIRMNPKINSGAHRISTVIMN